MLLVYLSSDDFSLLRTASGDPIQVHAGRVVVEYSLKEYVPRLKQRTPPVTPREAPPQQTKRRQQPPPVGHSKSCNAMKLNEELEIYDRASALHGFSHLFAYIN